MLQTMFGAFFAESGNRTRFASTFHYGRCKAEYPNHQKPQSRQAPHCKWQK